VTIEEPVRITGTNTRAASLLSDSGVGPRQQPLPLNDAVIAFEPSHSAAASAGSATLFAEFSEGWINPPSVSTGADPAFGNGSASSTLLPQDPNALTATSAAAVRPDILSRLTENPSSTPVDPQPQGARTGESSLPALDSRNSDASQSKAQTEFIPILISARTRLVTESDGAALTHEGDAEDFGSPASQVNKAGVKPGDQRVPLAKDQLVQQATGNESYRASDGAEPFDARTAIAQSLQNKSADKPAPEPDRPIKAGGSEIRDNTREGLPGMSATTDPKPVATPRESQVSASRPSEFVYQIAERIQTQLQSGAGELRIHLKPENLGNLEIKAESGLSGIVARIETESSSVKQYLESNLHSLQQSLQDQGLKVDRIEVVLQENLDFRHSNNHQQPGQTGSGQQGSEAGHSDGRSRPGSSFAEGEIVVDPWIASALGPNSTFHAVA
jgi:hypothetical protein